MAQPSPLAPSTAPARPLSQPTSPKDVSTPERLVKLPTPEGPLTCVRAQVCGVAQMHCRDTFLGNTMTQWAPGRQPRLMFLHTNLSPKWNLNLPGSYKDYTRRWQARSACCTVPRLMAAVSAWAWLAWPGSFLG